ncbi:hypothetical protein H4219_000338 [Mycoemilia scoparia]|uniref:Uncharacterized protein n=1 Tax=Mycoemilia scoparia TaxID=417184 RepID=A0A9W8A9J3_9FUNG|nr:hypothetical protein H4219_000338 [Mycoemilia scoparia]
MKLSNIITSLSTFVLSACITPATSSPTSHLEKRTDSLVPRNLIPVPFVGHKPDLLSSLLDSDHGLLGNNGLVCNILSNLGLCDYLKDVYIPIMSQPGGPYITGKPQAIPFSQFTPNAPGIVPFPDYDRNLLDSLLDQHDGLLGNHGLVCNILSHLGLCDYINGRFLPLYQPGNPGGSYIPGPWTAFPNVPSIGYPPQLLPFQDYKPNLLEVLLGPHHGLLGNHGLVCNILSNLGLCDYDNTYFIPLYPDSHNPQSYVCGAPQPLHR